ncbi:MAG: hypothetical protein HY286_10035 [Planctomycetes bacterium]|nr:hypothetical protein [Planctomycetota bacterium]
MLQLIINRRGSKPVARSVALSLLIAAVAPAALFAQSPDVRARNTSVNNNTSKYTDSSGFIENVGQWDRRILFAAESPAGRFLFHSDGFVLSVDCNYAADASIRGSNLFFTTEGADKNSNYSAGRGLDSESLFFLGSDPSTWAPDIQDVERIVHHSIQPGIDLVYYKKGGDFEYDYVLAPGCDPGTLTLRIDGAERIFLGEDGSLCIETRMGIVREPRPTTYQLSTSGERSTRHCNYKILSPTSVTFEIENLDITQSTIIDPALVYSTFLSGAKTEWSACDVSAAGECVMGGYTDGFHFPTTPGAFDTTAPLTKTDGFITKFNASGSALVFSTYLGGATADDYVSTILLNASDQVYVAGFSGSTDFPVTNGAYKKTTNAFRDCTFTRMNSSGSAILFSTFVGGSSYQGDNRPFAIALDDAGSLYATGETQTPDYPTTPGAYDTTYNGVGIHNIFVTKLNPFFGTLIYSTFVSGASGSSDGERIALGSDKSVYVVGFSFAADFPTTAGTVKTTHGIGGSDGIAFHLSSTGSSLLYSTFLGGTGSASDDVKGLAVLPDGSVILCGSTDGFFPTTANAWNTTIPPQGPVGFVTKLTPAADQYVFSTFIGGSGITLTDLHVGSDGVIYCSGYVQFGDLAVTPDAFDSSFNGGIWEDATLAKLDPTGSGLLYSTYLGGGIGSNQVPFTFERPYHFAMDAANNLYIVVHEPSVDFPTTSGSYQSVLDLIATSNAAIVKFNISGAGMGLQQSGTGTPGCLGPHTIWGNYSPKVNSPNFRLTCTQCPPNTLGLGLVGDVPDTLGSDPFGIGLTLYISIASTELLTFDFISDAFNNGRALAPIPNDPSLIGKKYYAQAIWYWATGCVPSSLSLSSSNAIEITIQQ